MLIRTKTKDCLKINKEMEKSMEKRLQKKRVSFGGLHFLGDLSADIWRHCMKMGGANMMQTVIWYRIRAFDRHSI